MHRRRQPSLPTQPQLTLAGAAKASAEPRRSRGPPRTPRSGDAHADLREPRGRTTGVKPFRVIGLVLAVTATVPVTASADGLPVGRVDAGRAGVPSPNGATRYVTRKLGQDTRVAELGGPRRSVVVRSRVVRGRFTIPAVALDATPSGLSADGRTLVLINPRRTFPRKRTAFTVLEATTLRVRTVLELRGDYSFDALSPNGRWLYLILYTSSRDPQRYAVRAYDLRAGRMLPTPIVDPREPDEAMRGFPLTRATSANGRWEYTLYDGGDSHPFIHALDTVGRKVLCVDLDALRGNSNLGNLRLRPEPGGMITVHYRGPPMAFVDRTTRRVTSPRFDTGDPAPAPARERATRPEPLPRGVQIALVSLLAVALIAGAASLAIGGRRHSTSAPTRDGRRDDEHWFQAP